MSKIWDQIPEDILHPWYPLAEIMSKNRGPSSCRNVAPMYPLVEDVSEIYAHPLPKDYAIFLFAIEYSAKAQHTTTGGPVVVVC